MRQIATRRARSGSRGHVTKNLENNCSMPLKYYDISCQFVKEPMSTAEPTLTQHVYNQLRRRLLQGELGGRAQLVHRTLARRTGHEYDPVGEAISRLASEGLVEYVPGAGAFVREPDRRELAQLYVICARRSSRGRPPRPRRNASAYELEELQALCDAWERLRCCVPARGHANRTLMSEWLDLEEKFHAVLAAATRNPWLERSLTGVPPGGPRLPGTERSEPALFTPRHWCWLDFVEEHQDLVPRCCVVGSPCGRGASAPGCSEHIRHGRGVARSSQFDQPPRQTRRRKGPVSRPPD